MKKYNLVHFSYDDYKITEETKNEEVAKVESAAKQEKKTESSLEKK